MDALSPPRALVGLHFLPAVSEATLLAALWLLDSREAAERSSATACINAYLKFLAAISQQVGIYLAACQHRLGGPAAQASPHKAAAGGLKQCQRLVLGVKQQNARHPLGLISLCTLCTFGKPQQNARQLHQLAQSTWPWPAAA